MYIFTHINLYIYRDLVLRCRCVALLVDVNCPVLPLVFVQRASITNRLLA